MAARRVNPKLLEAFRSASVEPPLEPFDYSTPGKVIAVPVDPSQAPAPAPAPAQPKSRLQLIQEYLDANRQPIERPDVGPEVDVRGAAEADARAGMLDAFRRSGQAFLGRADRSPVGAFNANETQALGEKARRQQALTQWAEAKRKQAGDEADIIARASVEPREASKPSKTPEQVDRELDIKEQDAETRRLNATKVKPPKAPKEADSSKLRKEFDALPEVKSFKDVSIGMDKIRSAAQSGTASGDMALIFAFMKILDPGSSVKEGEYASAKNAQGVPDKVLTAYNNAKDGQILSPAARAEFLKSAEQLYETERARYSATAQRYRAMAEKQRLAPDDVAVDRGPAQGPEPMVNVKRKSDGKVLPLPKSKAETLDKAKYEVMP